MSLNDQLTEDLKQAMKAKDAMRLRTIRSLRAALKEKEIAERRDGEAHLSEEQVLAVVQKQAKQRRDAIAQYEPAGRDDLAAKEQEELEIIETYLPKQLGDEEIRRVVQERAAQARIHKEYQASDGVSVPLDLAEPFPDSIDGSERSCGALRGFARGCLLDCNPPAADDADLRVRLRDGAADPLCE